MINHMSFGEVRSLNEWVSQHKEIKIISIETVGGGIYKYFNVWFYIDKEEE